jgi:CarD family transcriptional regulator
MEVNMFKIGECILYKGTGVCRIEGITEREFGENIREYYVLKPLEKKGATIYVPADSEKSLAKMREVLSADEIKELIDDMRVDEDISWIDDANLRKNLFRDAINSGEPRRLIRTVKTLRSRKRSLLQRGKKLNMTDTQFMKDAERLLYDEFAMGLNIKPDEVNSFIIEQMKKKEKI